MFTNYIKTAYRNMMRNFSQTLINVLGLAVGMTCALLIFLWVQNQLNYDKWQDKSDRMYRLEYKTWVNMPPYIADHVNTLPEIEDIVRFFATNETVTYEENSFILTDLAYADSTIFNVFTFDFLYGIPENALQKPASIVLTESISKKFFGNENPIGKEILLDIENIFTVTGVIVDVKNLHLDINAIVAAQDVKNIYGEETFLTSRSHNFLIYVLLKPYIDKDLLMKKIHEYDFDELKDDGEDELLLRPFEEVYFERNLPHDWGTKHGNYNLVLIFSAISFLILLIACINFINISTAKAKLREKEIGMRKIVGATRKSLIAQFMGETFILVIIAYIISIVLLEYFLPIFNNVTGESIIFNYLSLNFLKTISIIIIITTLLSGFYPAIYLSSLKPVLILKSKSSKKSSKGGLRKVLITVQFTISIFLIIATIIIIKQLNFVLNRDLGWNQEYLITFEMKGNKFYYGNPENITSNKTAFTEELLKNPNIKNVTYLNMYPGNIDNSCHWDINGDGYQMQIIYSDPELVNTLDLEIIQGRNLSFDYESDKKRKVIINETAIKYLGLEDPIGAIVDDSGLEVIGVVKDFNFNSLHSKIIPMGIIWDYWVKNTCIKVSGENLPSTIKHIESTFHNFSPKFPFNYKFLDETFSEEYENEVRLSKILIFFALITIFIAGLGLFGMSAFMGATRTKEIGIRKALGSSISDILFLFSKDFLRRILIAFVIASPIAWYSVKKWLMQYPYQTSIDWWVFLVALIITIVVAIITIGYQVIKAARTNPADCLRYE